MEENSLEFATGFAKSIRGKFILGQALHYAIIELEKKITLYEKLATYLT